MTTADVEAYAIALTFQGRVKNRALRPTHLLDLSGLHAAEPLDLPHHLLQSRAISRDALAGAELKSVEVVADKAEPAFAAVTPLHAALLCAGWSSTPSAQNSLQASLSRTRHC